MKQDLTLDKIQTAYYQSAEIVALYGEVYIPIFERLEKEYNERKEKLETVERAKKIASTETNLRIFDL